MAKLLQVLWAILVADDTLMIAWLVVLAESDALMARESACKVEFHACFVVPGPDGEAFAALAERDIIGRRVNSAL